METGTAADVAARSESSSPPTSVLVLASPLDAERDNVCKDLLTAAEPEELRVLDVDVTRSSARVRRQWTDAVGAAPAAFAQVGVEYMEPDDGAGWDLDAEPRTEFVANPGELSNLGVAASAVLGDWTDADEQIVVCLRSVTTLLQYAEAGDVLSFVRTFLDHCVGVDALTHVHLDPNAVEDRIVASLRGQVDVAIDLVE